MPVNEFCIFVHCPFATNIHIEAEEIQKLKTTIAEETLGPRQDYILRMLYRYGPRTKNQILKDFKEYNISISDIDTLIQNLFKSKYIKKRANISKWYPGQYYFKHFRQDIPTGDMYFITETGKEKIKESKIIQSSNDLSISKMDIFNDVTTESLQQFWDEIDADKNIQSYKYLDEILSGSNKKEYFFNELDQPILLARFEIDNFSESLENDNLQVTLEFNNNMIYIYPTGVGLFSSHITVKGNEVAIRKKDTLEEKIHKVILEKINESNINDITSIQFKLEKFKNSVRYKDRFKLVEGFNLDRIKINKPAWIHKIYWFWDDEIFKTQFESHSHPMIKERRAMSKLNEVYGDNSGDDKDQYNLGQANNNLKDDEKQSRIKSCDELDVMITGNLKIHTTYKNLFENLMEQDLPNQTITNSRSVIYGWGRTLILTNDRNHKIEKWVKKKVNLIEIGQYSLFGNILLDYLLKKVNIKLSIERNDKDLTIKIEKLDRLILACTVYMDELQSGIDTILYAGSLSLVKTFENYWRLEKTAESIRKKLKSLYNQRLSMEQLVITEKQDRINITSTAFTIMGIAGAIAAIMVLSPLKEWFPGGVDNFLQTPMVGFTIFTLVIILITITAIFKGKIIGKRISKRIESWKNQRAFNKQINQVDLSRESKLDKEEHKQNLGNIRREIRDQFDKNTITESQYIKLKTKVNKKLAEILTQELSQLAIHKKNDEKLNQEKEIEICIMQDPDKEILRSVIKNLHSNNMLYDVLIKIPEKKLVFIKERILDVFNEYFYKLNLKQQNSLKDKTENR